MKKLLLSLGICVSIASLAQTSNGHASRYVFSPSGFGIEKDSAYLNVVGPLIDFQYGISDKVSVGIGTPFFLGGYVTASYHAQISDKLHIKTGLLAGVPTVGGGTFLLPFAVGTYGTPDNQFSFGVGYSSFNNDDFDVNGTALNIGGYHQLGSRLGFVYEGWYLPNTETAIFSPNFRIYTNRNKRYWNFGFANFSQKYYSITYPILGYDTNFDYIVDTQDPNAGGWPVYDYDNPTKFNGSWERFIIPTITFAVYL
ncbi:MAG: hypothetical protein ACO31K_06200 [Schleiferiaceae bacterium]